MLPILGARVVSLQASGATSDRILEKLWNTGDEAAYFQSEWPDGARMTGSVGRLVKAVTIEVTEVLAAKPCVEGGTFDPFFRCWAPVK